MKHFNISVFVAIMIVFCSHETVYGQSNSPPSCTGTNPENVVVTNLNTLQRVYVSGVTNTERIWYAVWTDEYGQIPGNLWFYKDIEKNQVPQDLVLTFNPQNHPGIGKVNVHVYMNGNGYSNIPCGQANFRKIGVSDDTPPTCIAVTPDDVSLPLGTTSHTITAIGVSSNTTVVNFAVWTEAAGQDLATLWNPGENKGNGIWELTINPNDYQGNGLVNVHAFMNNAGLINEYCDFGNFSKGILDTTPPIINDWNAQPGQSVTVSWDLTDEGGAGLNRIIIYRASVNKTCTLEDAERCVWTHAQEVNAPLNLEPWETWRSSSIDRPNDGTYIYGIHVWDNAGKVTVSRDWLIEATSSESGYYFDAVNHEFVLTEKEAMDPGAAKGIWLGNKKLKVYRNIHGSNWISADYGFEGKYSGFALNPAKPILPNFTGGGITYINDEQTHWSNNPYQVEINEDNFESRVGMGYTKNNLPYRNIDMDVTYFVPSYDIGDPVAIQLVKVRNTSESRRTLRLFSYYDVIQNGKASWNGNSISLSGGSGYPGLFLASTEAIAGFDTNKRSFFGSGTEPNPAGVVAGRLSNSANGDDDILALQSDVVLDPDEERTIAFVFGTFSSNAERDALVSKYSSISTIKSVLDSTKAFYEAKTGNIPGLSQRDAQLETQLRLLGFSALSASLWWDNFIGKFQLNQMSQYMADVNARDTAQIALGLMYMDPILARDGLQGYMHSQQRFSGYIPYGYNSYIGRGSVYADETRTWGSDNIAWITFASCEYLEETGDTAWLNARFPYIDSDADETVYTHLMKALNYEYSTQVDGWGLLTNRKGDWLDQATGVNLDDGSSIYSSALLLAATNSCLPFMSFQDRALYSYRSNVLRNSIEINGFDVLTGRYIRWITEDGFRIGSWQDQNRVFSDLAVTALSGILDPTRVRSTVLASYGTNQVTGDKGNLVYTPSYLFPDLGLGAYTLRNDAYDNKIWGRVCSVVTAGLKKVGLEAEAEQNFLNCLPSSWGGGRASPFNYVEYFDYRGDVVMCDPAIPWFDCSKAKRISRIAYSNAVDDSMAIWAQAQLAQ